MSQGNVTDYIKLISIKHAGLSKNKKLSTNLTVILFQSRNEFFPVYGTYTLKKPPAAPKLRNRLGIIPNMHSFCTLDKP